VRAFSKMVFRVRVDIVTEEKVFRVRVFVLFQKWSLELELTSLRKKKVFRVRVGVVTEEKGL
jgi:hypothetical protein